MFFSHFAFFAVLYAIVVVAQLPHPLFDEFIDIINSKNSTWKAGRNFAADIPFHYIKNLVGDQKDDYVAELPCKHFSPDVIEDLPKYFDPIDKWPYCPTLYEIRDQGSCRSCWAVAAVEVMTDRVCISSKGTKHFYFSANDLLSCCKTCGHGCRGGNATRAWMYWNEYGLVSGGSYNSNQGCQSYEIPPCEHNVPGNRVPCRDYTKKPECLPTCAENYDKEYNTDKRKGKNHYRVCDGEDQIKAEIYEKGPVEATFTVYSDFLHYQYGVYQHTLGTILGKHSVKIMGWGLMNDTKYWLIANSWNSDWGAMGFFKIVRGTNHCGIEDEILAGDPEDI